jgi:hypothetical protein
VIVYSNRSRVRGEDLLCGIELIWASSGAYPSLESALHSLNLPLTHCATNVSPSCIGGATHGYCQLGAEEAKLPRAQPSRECTSAHEGNTSRIAPGEEGAITSSSVLTGREAMTAELEVVVDPSVGGEKLLGLPG